MYHNQKKSNMSKKNQLSPDQTKELIETLTTRFEKNQARHKGISWDKVKAKLEASPEKLWILDEMEVTGGEPDVIGYDEKAAAFVFCDCSTGEAFVMIGQPGSHGRPTNPKIRRWMWQPKWVSRF
jgi:hypothetical protein